MKILVVGAGGIGSPLVAGLLAAVPAADVIVVDSDRVERSNLPRQPWFGAKDIGQPKVEVLAQALNSPRVSVRTERVDAAFEWPQIDLVLDATDNWPVRHTIQNYARAAGIPWVFASAVRWEGQAAWMHPGGPCLRCLFGTELSEGLRCFEAGVVGLVTLAVAGQVLALVGEWLKDPGSPQLNRLYLLEGRRGKMWSVGFPRGGCPHGNG